MSTKVIGVDTVLGPGGRGARVDIEASRMLGRRRDILYNNNNLKTTFIKSHTVVTSR